MENLILNKIKKTSGYTLIELCMATAIICFISLSSMKIYSTSSKVTAENKYRLDTVNFVEEKFDELLNINTLKYMEKQNGSFLSNGILIEWKITINKIENTDLYRCKIDVSSPKYGTEHYEILRLICSENN